VNYPSLTEGDFPAGKLKKPKGLVPRIFPRTNLIERSFEEGRRRSKVIPRFLRLIRERLKMAEKEEEVLV